MELGSVLQYDGRRRAVVRMIRPEWLVIQAADILPMMYWRIAQLTRLLATCNVVDLSHRAKCC